MKDSDILISTFVILVVEYLLCLSSRLRDATVFPVNKIGC